MTDPENRRVLLNARPVGVPGPEFFDIVTRPADPVGDGEFRVRNLYLSIDPAMRGWINNAPNYSPPVPSPAAPCCWWPRGDTRERSSTRTESR